MCANYKWPQCMHHIAAHSPSIHNVYLSCPQFVWLVSVSHIFAIYTYRWSSLQENLPTLIRRLFKFKLPPLKSSSVTTHLILFSFIFFLLFVMRVSILTTYFLIIIKIKWNYADNYISSWDNFCFSGEML